MLFLTGVHLRHLPPGLDLPETAYSKSYQCLHSHLGPDCDSTGRLYQLPRSICATILPGIHGEWYQPCFRSNYFDVLYQVSYSIKIEYNQTCVADRSHL